MSAPLRNLALSAVLIAVPAGGFSAAEMFVYPASSQRADAAGQGLGDLSAYQGIVTDTQKIARSGDLAAAETRVTDLETLWDQNAHDMRKADPAAWSAVDGAADKAFSALRAGDPDPAKVEKTLANLQDTLAHPAPAAGSAQQVQTVAGVAVTDDTGNTLPCEMLVGQVRDALKGAKPSAEVADLESKALERCNADDEARADSFAARALAKIRG